MQRVYSHPNPLLVAHWRNLLEEEGIRCQVRNLDLLAGAGELAPTGVWPELWVERPTDHARAFRLIEEMLHTEPAGNQPPWRCPGCSEQLEAQFHACWRCGRRRPFGT